MSLLDCCKCISFFGILFYVAMGLIILGQSEFLKFHPENKMSSVGACFVTAVIQLLIFVGIIVYQRWKEPKNVTRQNYYDLKEERDPKKHQSQFKGIAMGDLKLLREQKKNQMMREK